MWLTQANEAAEIVRRKSVEKAATRRKSVEKAETRRKSVEKAETRSKSVEKAETRRKSVEKAATRRKSVEKAETRRKSVEKAEAKRIAKEAADKPNNKYTLNGLLSTIRVPKAHNVSAIPAPCFFGSIVALSVALVAAVCVTSQSHLTLIPLSNRHRACRTVGKCAGIYAMRVRSSHEQILYARHLIEIRAHTL